MEAGISGEAPVDRLAALLTEAKLDDAAAHEGFFQLYKELKECYEAQDRAGAANDYVGEQDEELKQLCVQASLLFVARVVYAAQPRTGKLVPSNLGCPISRIVAAAGISLLEFFREVNLVVSKLSSFFEARGGSSKLFMQQAHLKENSETVVVMGLLAKKYKDSFNLFMHQLEFYKQVVLRLGWSLFLVLKTKLLSVFPDVVSCVELLPCIFAVLVSHAPRLPDCLGHLSQGMGPAILKTIAENCKADYGRVQARMMSVESLILQILTAAVPEWRTAPTTLKEREKYASADGTTKSARTSALDIFSSPVLEGLVTNADRMQRALVALEAEYEQHYRHGGSELDEREFLYADFTKFASPRLSPGRMHSAFSRSGPMPLRQGALLGPGAHTTVPQSASPHLMYAKPMPVGAFSPLPMLNLSFETGQPNTPVSEVMGAAAWLRAVTTKLAAEPSPSLMRYLAELIVPLCGSESGSISGSSTVAEQLSQRVRELVSSVMAEEANPSAMRPFPLLQTSLVAERRTEVTKLYYHSLENILRSEEKASGLTGVAALLSAGKFHRALVACCAEVVAACYRMVSCAFPKVLDALHIKAFDLVKLIQSFVKSIETLPRELKRHLFLIEERILESLAWEPGSSLYHHVLNISSKDAVLKHGATSIIAELGDTLKHADVSRPLSACTHIDVSGSKLPDAEDRLGSTDRSVVSLNDTCAVVSAPPPSPKRPQGCMAFGFMSPAKKVRGIDGSPQPVQQRPLKLPKCVGPDALEASGTGSAGALYEFCRKVMKLAAFRLALMCDNFDFSPLDRDEVVAKVYETIKHALFHETHLFYNRHIDQIILSALYGFCKVHKLAQISFREIIAHYRKQPQAQQCIFRSVIIEQSNPDLQVATRADIIAFYNQVFVPSMKSYLLKVETSSAGINGPEPEGQTGHQAVVAVKDVLAAFATAGDIRCGAASPVQQGDVKSPRSLALLPMRGPKGQAEMEDVHVSRKASSARVVDDLCPVKAAKTCPESTVASPAGPRSALNCSPSRARGFPDSICSSGLRAKSTAPMEHQIPDGLAALLQALDTQQGFQDGPAEEVSRPERRINVSTEDVSTGDGARDEGFTCMERRVKLEHVPKVVGGRRQRTPNRRYGE